MPPQDIFGPCLGLGWSVELSSEIEEGSVDFSLAHDYCHAVLQVLVAEIGHRSGIFDFACPVFNGANQVDLMVRQLTICIYSGEVMRDLYSSW